MNRLSCVVVGRHHRVVLVTKGPTSVPSLHPSGPSFNNMQDTYYLPHKTIALEDEGQFCRLQGGSVCMLLVLWWLIFLEKEDTSARKIEEIRVLACDWTSVGVLSSTILGIHMAIH